MDESLRLAIAAVGAPIVAWVMWRKIAQPIGQWILDRIPPGPIKDMLKKDRGGYY